MSERSQAWLARKLKVSRSALNQWMRGRMPTPSERRAQIAALLGIRLPEED